MLVCVCLGFLLPLAAPPCISTFVQELEHVLFVIQNPHHAFPRLCDLIHYELTALKVALVWTKI